MTITINPRGVLQIDDAEILGAEFRNFSGRPSKYNRAGDRNFALKIPDLEAAQMLRENNWNVKVSTGNVDLYNELSANGWNVKYVEEMKPDHEPYIRLDVKVKYGTNDAGEEYGPNVYLIIGNKTKKLTSENIHRLDNISIESIPMMDIRPYDWQLDDGSSGRTAYLNGMKVVQFIDRITSDCEGGSDDEAPFDAD